MESNTGNSAQFDEKQSIEVIKSMIAVSKKNLNNDGLLILVWGWLMSIGAFISFYLKTFYFLYLIRDIIKYLNFIYIPGLILFTSWYMYKKRKLVKTYIALSTRYAWLSILVVFNLMIIILRNKIGHIDFTLNHPLQMLLIGLGIFITGSNYRNKLLMAGGGVIWILALISSNQEINYQMLYASIAYFIAFVIPGHIMFYQYKNR